MITNQSNRVTGLTEGSIFAAVRRLTLPMLAGAVLQNFQSLIDLFWVGRLGHVAVAGVAMAGTVIMILFPGIMGLATGTVAMIARAIGARRELQATQTAGQSVLMACALGLLLGMAGWFCADPLLRLLGASPDAMQAGSAYLKISMAGSMTMFVLFIANAALQGAGDTLTPTCIMATGTIVNILLDPLLIFGLGPVPGFGVRGAAAATVLAQALSAAIALYVLISGRGALRLTRACWKPRPGLAWQILRIGIPGSGQMLSRSLMGAVIMRIVSQCGTSAVAAYGTGMRLHMIVLMPAFALGGAAATMVGQNLGAGQPDRARRAAWTAVGIDTLFMTAAIAVLYPFAGPLIGLFNRNPEVIAIGTDYLRIVSPFYFFAGLGIVLNRALQGAGDTMAPMLLTILVLWGLQVPLALWLARTWHTPTTGIWIAMAAALVIQGLLTVIWFEIGRWRRIELLSDH